MDMCVYPLAYPLRQRCENLEGNHGTKSSYYRPMTMFIRVVRLWNVG